MRRPESTVTALIAVERFLRGLLLVAAGIYLSGHTHDDFGRLAYRLARAINVDPQRPFVRHVIDRLHGLSHDQLLLIGIGGLLYGLLELVEGVGLWLDYLWAEWLTVIATSLFVPFELYELVHRPTPLKAAGTLVNVLVVLWLVRSVRRRTGRRRDRATAAQ